MTECEAKTQGVLLGNAAFSMANGIGFLVAGGAFARLIHPALAPWLVQLTGAGLIVFAIVLILIARQDRLLRKIVWLIVGADLAWVAGSLLALALWGATMPAAGLWFVIVVALTVTGFAIFQTGGLMKSAKASG